MLPGGCSIRCARVSFTHGTGKLPTISRPAHALQRPALTQQLHQRRCMTVCQAKENYYDILGVEFDADEDEIRTAYRRRAKELHPDVNKEDDADEAFKQLGRAYETLSNADSRRTYDAENRIRRLNFFRDVDEDSDGVDENDSWRPPRRSGFRWSDVGSPLEEEEAGGRKGAGNDDDDDDDGKQAGGSGREQMDPDEFMERMARFMGGQAGGLRAWQSGRLDPWGTSSSDAWFRQVEKQTRSPYGPGRPGYGALGSDDDDPNREWDPSRRTPGWQPPGRGSEWSHPRRQWDEEDQRGGLGGGGGKPGGGGGGDFRRPFKI